jgi:hypothetical protein
MRCRSLDRIGPVSVAGCAVRRLPLRGRRGEVEGRGEGAGRTPGPGPMGPEGVNVYGGGGWGACHLRTGARAPAIPRRGAGREPGRATGFRRDTTHDIPRCRAGPPLPPQDAVRLARGLAEGCARVLLASPGPGERADAAAVLHALAAPGTPAAVGDAVWLALARVVGAGPPAAPPPPAPATPPPSPLTAADFGPAERLLPGLWAEVGRAHLRRAGRAAREGGGGIGDAGGFCPLPASLLDGREGAANGGRLSAGPGRAEGDRALREVLAKLSAGPPLPPADAGGIDPERWAEPGGAG